MSFDMFSLFATGLMPLPWWGYVVVALFLTHITIASVTIYLHRSQAHRGLDLHPIASHFFRFWLWLTTGMVTKEWVAIHRKHHAKVETADDPHSPQTRGIDKVFWEGAELYRDESKNPETLEKYGVGTPNDWIERKGPEGKKVPVDSENFPRCKQQRGARRRRSLVPSACYSLAPTVGELERLEISWH